jgi:hypothetical protein
VDFNGKTILFVDFETFFDSKGGYGLKQISLTEYIRDSRFKAHGLAYNDGSGTHWLAGEHVIAGWVDSIDWPDTVVVAHNVKFDGAILAWRYRVKPYAWFDTVALAKAVLGEQVSGYHLKGLADFLGLPAKGELTCDGVLNPSADQLAALGEYCKNDVELCKGIYEKLAPKFPQSQLFHMDWTVRCFLEPRLVLNIGALENGVQTEKSRRESVVAASGVERDILSSNGQFAAYLASLGVTVSTKVSVRTGERIPAFAKTDAGLEALRLSHPELYAARLAAKSSLLETRGQALLDVGKTGTFPFDVGFSGAVQTHRYSGGSGAGGNPQNFTRNSFLRRAVSAPSGSSLVVGDFAAIELRILSWLAREPRLINQIINDGDVYSEFASLFYKRPITKADKVERQFGKCAILGLGYGMGWTKFQATVKQQTKIDLSEKDARATVDLYRSTYFNVPRLWQQATAMIPLIMEGKVSCLFFAPFIKVEKNALVLPSGLRVQYPNLRWMGDECVYDVYKKKYAPEPTKLYGGKLIENICQALAGELCKEAIRRAEEAGLKCVGQVHDEILAVSPDGESAVRALEQLMARSPSWWPAIKLKAEVGTGPNWAEAKR